MPLPSGERWELSTKSYGTASLGSQKILLYEAQHICSMQQSTSAHHIRQHRQQSAQNNYCLLGPSGEEGEQFGQPMAKHLAQRCS